MLEANRSPIRADLPPYLESSLFQAESFETQPLWQMEHTPKLILFDLMKTLLDIDEEVAPYWHRMGEQAERMGLADATLFNDRYTRWRVDRDGKDKDREVTLQARLALILPEVPVTNLSELVAVYIEDYLRRTRPAPGVEAMLRAWHGKTPMGVISNFFVSEMPRRLLQHHCLLGYFDFVIDSATLQIRKPNSKIFLAALRQAGLSPSDAPDVIMVGDDASADVAGAQASGITPLLFRPSEQCAIEVPVFHSWDAFRPHEKPK